MSDRRDDFLIEMYKQMFININRHITIIWQSISVLVGAFAVFSLVSNQVISLDLAASIMVLLAGWLCAHMFDANCWFNRNVGIITNIERQFLNGNDAKNIHFYFTQHRPNKLISHLRIQMFLGVALATLVIIYHFNARIVPGLGSPWTNIEPVRWLPYLCAISAIVWCWFIRRSRQQDYEDFLATSPGVEIIFRK